MSEKPINIVVTEEMVLPPLTTAELVEHASKINAQIFERIIAAIENQYIRQMDGPLPTRAFNDPLPEPSCKCRGVICNCYAGA